MRSTRSPVDDIETTEAEIDEPKHGRRFRQKTPMESSNSESVERIKSVIFQFVGTKLKECQTLGNDQNNQKELLHEMKLFYYEKFPENPTFQKQFASIVWRMMLIPFSSERTASSCDLVIKFFHKMVLSFGTEEDMKRYKPVISNLPPFYLHIVHFMEQCHVDARPLVRTRILELIHDILKKFSDDVKFVHEPSPTIKGILLKRLQDRCGAIRTLAVQCLGYYVVDSEVRKLLTYHVRSDPCVEVRKHVLHIFRESSHSGKTACFLHQAYNKCENMRYEAIIGLSRIPLKRIQNKEERQRLVMWGLTQPCQRVQMATKNNLLPAWLGCCENNILVLLEKINPNRKLQVSRSVVRAIYTEYPIESNDPIPSGFLKPGNIIPLEELNPLKAQVWFLLCEVFVKQPDRFQKLCPDGAHLCKLLINIFNDIGQQQDGDDLDSFTVNERVHNLHLCLLYVLRIAKLVFYEESTRREMVQILKNFLSELNITEAVVLVEVMHLLSIVMGNKIEFEESIESVLHAIFEPRIAIVSGKEIDDGPVASTPKRNISNYNLDSNSNDLMDTHNFSLDERLKLADTMLHKHKLISRKERCLKDSNFEEAKEIDKELSMVFELEKELRNHQGNEPSSGNLKSPEFETAEKTLDGDNLSKDRLESPLSHISDVDLENSQNESTPEVFALLDSGILKGLVLLGKYLSHRGKITPFIRSLHSDYILFYLTDNSGLIRKYVLYAICEFAFLEEEHARKAMQVSIAALQNDPDKIVRHAGFKCMVDLLTHFDPEIFREAENDDPCPMCPPLNNPHATRQEIEDLFATLLFNSFKDDKINLVMSPYDTTIKVKAYVKLFLADRLTSETLLADLLCFYIDTACGNVGLTNSFHVGCFVPLYVSLNLRNGIRVIKAFLLSLKFIYDGNDDQNSSFHDLDPSKFISFIVNNTSPSILVKLKNSNELHETLALDLLREVKRNVRWKYNSDLAKIIRFLTVERKSCIHEIKKLTKSILEKIQPLVQSVDISKLKSTLTRLLKDMEKNMPDPEDQQNLQSVLNDIGMEINLEVAGNEKKPAVEPLLEIDTL